MTPRDSTEQDRQAAAFSEQVDQKSTGMVGEFWGMLRDNKKWWLTPIIAAAILLGVFMLLFGTPLSPLIYSLF